MTQTAKTASWTLVGFVAAAGMLFGLWDKVVPILDWLAPILAFERVQHVVTAWLIAAFTLPTPWVLPKHLAPIWTRSMSALVAFATAVIVHAALAWPLSRTDLVYAIGMAGMGAIVWNQALTALYLHLRPKATPESLQP